MWRNRGVELLYECLSLPLYYFQTPRVGGRWVSPENNNRLIELFWGVFIFFKRLSRFIFFLSLFLYIPLYNPLCWCTFYMLLNGNVRNVEKERRKYQQHCHLHCSAKNWHLSRHLYLYMFTHTQVDIDVYLCPHMSLVLFVLFLSLLSSATVIHFFSVSGIASFINKLCSLHQTRNE